MLTDKIQQDAMTALKAGDKSALSILRFVISKIKNLEIEKKRLLTNDEVIAIVKKEKQNLSVASEFADQNKRQDLVVDNKKQINVLSSYLSSDTKNHIV